MWAWIRDRFSARQIVFAALVAIFVPVRTIFGLNIERWAEKHRLDNVLTENEGLVISLFATTAEFFVSDLFVGFVIGGLAVSAWGFVASLLTHRAHQSAPTNKADATTHREIVIAGYSSTPPLEEVRERSGDVPEGMSLSNRNDFDIIPDKLIIRGTLNRDGVDITALVAYRNRSMRPVYLKGLDAKFILNGNKRERNANKGLKSPVSSGTTDLIRFSEVRVYNTDSNPIGSARLFLMFGPSQNEMTAAIDIRHEFTVLTFPKNTSVDAKLEARVKTDIRYYASEQSLKMQLPHSNS